MSALAGDQYMQLLLERQAEYVATHPPKMTTTWAPKPLLEWFVRDGDEELFTPPTEAPQPKRETTPRVYRTAASLRAERDPLVARRDAIAGGAGVPDRAAAGGQALGHRRTARQQARNDSALRRYVELDQRVKALDDRIARAERREAAA